MFGWRLLRFSAVAAWLLTGCAGEYVSPDPIDRLPLEQAKQLVAGKTVMTFVGDSELWVHTPFCLPGTPCGGPTKIEGPGTLVEYFAPDGRSFLWYPGGDTIGRYKWAVAKRQGRYDVCFYQHDTPRGPLMASSQCILLSAYVATVTEKREGDLLDLGSGRLPFVLLRDKSTLGDLLKRAAQ